MTIRVGETDVEVERVEALEIRKDDVIVLTVPSYSDDASAQAIRSLFAQMFPGRKVAVVYSGVEISIARETP